MWAYQARSRSLALLVCLFPSVLFSLTFGMGWYSGGVFGRSGRSRRELEGVGGSRQNRRELERSRKESERSWKESGRERRKGVGNESERSRKKSEESKVMERKGVGKESE